MNELLPVILPFAACIVFFVIWLAQQKKALSKPSTTKTASLVAPRENVLPERTAEPINLQTSTV